MLRPIVGRGGNAVVIAMGDAGFPSRVLAERFGSRWTYAGNAVAPGQVPASRMIDEFRFRAITSGTRGVRRRRQQRDAFDLARDAQRGVRRRGDTDAAYVPLRAADFEDFLTFADAMCGLRARASDDSLQARCPRGGAPTSMR